jgi:beta-lactamase class A
MFAFLLAVAITIPHTDATVGYTAIDIETGRTLSSNGTDHFPMASVFKFPVALAVLQRVDAGDFKLDDPITIQPSQFSHGHSPLRDSASGKAVTVTVKRMIELMVVESDNTPVDYFIRRLGGATITSRLHGATGVRVDRPENDIAEFIAKNGIAAYVITKPSPWAALSTSLESFAVASAMSTIFIAIFNLLRTKESA